MRAAAAQLRGDAASQATGREALFATSVAAFREQVELLGGAAGADLAQLNAVAYVDAARMSALNMNEDALHAHASRTFVGSGRWRRPDRPSTTAASSSPRRSTRTTPLVCCSFPERLRESEELAALIPDRDTLVIAPVPADGDWGKLHRLAKACSGPPLFSRALRVSPSGIRAA